MLILLDLQMTRLWLMSALYSIGISVHAAPTFIVPLASNIPVPAAVGSGGVGLGVLDVQSDAIGFAVTVANLSDIHAVDIRAVRHLVS